VKQRAASARVEELFQYRDNSFWVDRLKPPHPAKRGGIEAIEQTIENEASREQAEGKAK
jgi:hypothetical protein